MYRRKFLDRHKSSYDYVSHVSHVNYVVASCGQGIGLSRRAQSKLWCSDLNRFHRQTNKISVSNRKGDYHEAIPNTEFFKTVLPKISVTFFGRVDDLTYLNDPKWFLWKITSFKEMRHDLSAQLLSMHCCVGFCPGVALRRWRIWGEALEWTGHQLISKEGNGVTCKSPFVERCFLHLQFLKSWKV